MPKGSVTLTAALIDSSHMSTDVVRAQIHGINLDKKDGFFGKSDPYFIIKKVLPDTSKIEVMRSHTVMKNLNPDWGWWHLPIDSVAGGNIDRAVEMEVWDWDRSGDDDFIGSCTWSFVELTECAARGESFQRDLMAKGKQSGAVEFRNIVVGPAPTAQDFFDHGTKLKLTVAIDMHSSQLGWLHDGSKTSSPEAICAKVHRIAEYLRPWCSDDSMDAWCFGTGLPGRTAGYFALNFNDANPTVDDLDEFDDQLDDVVAQVTWSNADDKEGLHVLLHNLRKKDQAEPSFTATAQTYHVVVVLTSHFLLGAAEVKKELKKLSKHPFSVVLVDCNAGTSSVLAGLQFKPAADAAITAKDVIPRHAVLHLGSDDMAAPEWTFVSDLQQHVVEFAKDQQVQPLGTPVSGGGGGGC